MTPVVGSAFVIATALKVIVGFTVLLSRSRCPPTSKGVSPALSRTGAGPIESVLLACFR